jgi:hypothetical protein
VWAVDLINIQYYAKDNDNFRFILAVIDMFSKLSWMRALKNKTGTEVAHALSDIITSSGRKPTHVWCDKGAEFYNKRNWYLIYQDNLLQGVAMLYPNVSLSLMC